MLESHTDVTTLIRGNKIRLDELSHDEIGDDHLVHGHRYPACAKMPSPFPTKKRWTKLPTTLEKSCTPLASTSQTTASRV